MRTGGGIRTTPERFGIPQKQEERKEKDQANARFVEKPSLCYCVIEHPWLVWQLALSVGFEEEACSVNRRLAIY